MGSIDVRAPPASGFQTSLRGYDASSTECSALLFESPLGTESRVCLPTDQSGDRRSAAIICFQDFSFLKSSAGSAASGSSTRTGSDAPRREESCISESTQQRKQDGDDGFRDDSRSAIPECLRSLRAQGFRPRLSPAEYSRNALEGNSKYGSSEHCSPHHGGTSPRRGACVYANRVTATTSCFAESGTVE
jgi:hypothetical protein